MPSLQSTIDNKKQNDMKISQANAFASQLVKKRAAQIQTMKKKYEENHIDTLDIRPSEGVVKRCLSPQAITKGSKTKNLNICQMIQPVKVDAESIIVNTNSCQPLGRERNLLRTTANHEPKLATVADIQKVNKSSSESGEGEEQKKESPHSREPGKSSVGSHEGNNSPFCDGGSNFLRVLIDIDTPIDALRFFLTRYFIY